MKIYRILIDGCVYAHTMKTIRALILGMIEFRTDFTTHYDDLDLAEIYDRGRELMHRLTLRRYDD